MTQSTKPNRHLDPQPVVKRVLLVTSDASMGPRLREEMAQAGIASSLTQVPDYLAALGQAGTGPVPDLVFGDVRGLDGQAAATAAAFRQLAPHAQLIAIAPPDHQPSAQAAVAAGFDTWLASPISSQQLRCVLSAACQPQAACREQHAQPVTDPHSLLVPSIAPRSPDDTSPIGDVDLVEQLLSDRAGLPALAVQLIQQRSGLKGIAFVEAATAVPSGAVAVPVGDDRSLYGLLVAAPDTPVAQLRAWAAWLRHWLALKVHMDRTWDMAYHDQLTGVWNRRYFERFLAAALEKAAAERFTVTLMVFDIDDFKRYNDRYGHAAGDEVLRETARLMTSVIRAHDVVARIGGDEFGVIFWDHEAPRRPQSHHPTEVPQAAERFRRAVCTHKFPKLLDEAPGTLTISGGLASFPWDARTPSELLERADAMLLQSKRQGKNVITFGPGAVQARP